MPGRITSPSSTVIGVGIQAPAATLDVNGSGMYSTTLGVGGLLTATGGISIPDGVGLSSTISFPRTMIGRSGTSLSFGDPDGWTHAGYRIYTGSHSFSIGGTNYFNIANNLVTVTPPLIVAGSITASNGVSITGAGGGGAGRIYFDASSDGIVLRANTGATNDFTLYSQNAGSLLVNPTATRNLRVGNSGGTTSFPGPVTMASTVDVTGHISASGGLSVTGGTGGDGRLWKSSGAGLAIRGVTGFTYDLSLFNPAGQYLLRNPSGTQNLELPGMLNTTGNVFASGTGSGFWMGAPGTFHYGMYTTGSSLAFRSGSGSNFLTVNSSGQSTFSGAVTMSSNLTVSGDLTVATVKATTWEIGSTPDYVFEKDYELASLEKVESFVRKNKHLPEIPSAREMKAQGLDLVKMNFDLLKKVEELTLYVIEQEKRDRKHEEEITLLKHTITEMAKRR